MKTDGKNKKVTIVIFADDNKNTSIQVKIMSLFIIGKIRLPFIDSGLLYRGVL
jgi:hypothetical protein